MFMMMLQPEIFFYYYDHNINLVVSLNVYFKLYYKRLALHGHGFAIKKNDYFTFGRDMKWV